jgi:hypothetical protein
MYSVGPGTGGTICSMLWEKLLYAGGTARPGNLKVFHFRRNESTFQANLVG